MEHSHPPTSEDDEWPPANGNYSFLAQELLELATLIESGELTTQDAADKLRPLAHWALILHRAQMTGSGPASWLQPMGSVPRETFPPDAGGRSYLHNKFEEPGPAGLSPALAPGAANAPGARGSGTVHEVALKIAQAKAAKFNRLRPRRYRGKLRRRG